MLESWRNPVVNKMSWYNFKHSFLISFITFKLLTWIPFLWDALAWTLVLMFAYWFGFVLYRWLKRYNLAFQVASYKKAVLITGCDTGFGNALARKLATERGFQVFAACLNPEWEGGRKLAEIGNIHVLKMDVTKKEDVIDCLEKVNADLKASGNDLWAVVCNAGIAELGEFEWISMDSVRRHFEVNTFGTATVIQTFLPLLRASKGRVVINASVLGRHSFPGLIPYSMTKAACIALADGLKREMAVWDVDVSTVEPALYATTILDNTKTTRDRFLNEGINKLPESVRADYGEEYFKSFFTSASKNLDMHASPNPEEVVSALSHAITTVWPEAHYRVASWKKDIVYTLMDYLPAEFVDALIMKLAKHELEPNAVLKS